MMKREWMDVMKEMWNEGYAVIVWTPEELGGVDPDWVMDCSISYGHEYLLGAENEKYQQKKGGE
jgi:hypothetical protein